MELRIHYVKTKAPPIPGCNGESGVGEALVSQTVRDLARTSAGVSFEDVGERRLKGVSEPVRVWRVVGQRLAEQ